MNKTTRLIQSYLIYTFPAVLICILWNTVHTEAEIVGGASLLSRALWEFLSWNMMCWFTILVLFMAMLVTIPRVREQTLSRLANLKERDEREQYMTGKASRAAYLSTLSVMILFLFLSVLTVSIVRLPEGQGIHGKRGVVNIALNFALTDANTSAVNSGQREVLFEMKGFPLSKSGMILILLSWQLLSFNVASRKEQVLHS